MALSRRLIQSKPHWNRFHPLLPGPAKADAQGGTVVNTNQRKYLTDPPLEYRSVPQDQLADLGEPELKKEKQRKKDAAMAGTGKSWWNPFQ